MEYTLERTGPAPQHTEGVCRRCGCTDQEPCVHVDKGPCSWTYSLTLCTFCVTDQEARAEMH